MKRLLAALFAFACINASAQTFNILDNTTITGSTVTASTQFLAANGSATAPGYSWSAEPGLGIWRQGAGILGIAQGGFNRWQITVSSITGGSAGANALGSAAIGYGNVFSYKFTSTGSTVTPSACGTSPSVAGGDSAFHVTVGTGGVATSCTLTFNAWTNPPVCIVQNNTDRVSYSVVTTTTTLVITATAAFTASSIFHVHCIGR